VSELDCVPTTFLNALCFLFERSEIPAQVVQRVHLYSLDAVGTDSKSKQGTSTWAVQHLAMWLRDAKYERFSLGVEYLSDSEVHLQKRNKIEDRLTKGGVALLCINTKVGISHYILALASIDGWIHCFDPYPISSKESIRGQYEFIDGSALHTANLKISRGWLDAKNGTQPYQLGPGNDRECVLIRRTRYRADPASVA